VLYGTKSRKTYLTHDTIAYHSVFAYQPDNRAQTFAVDTGTPIAWHMGQQFSLVFRNPNFESAPGDRLSVMENFHVSPYYPREGIELMSQVGEDSPSQVPALFCCPIYIRVAALQHLVLPGRCGLWLHCPPTCNFASCSSPFFSLLETCTTGFGLIGHPRVYKFCC
jgi:hypothetical protein